ncbi:HEAT shock factor-binding protein 1 [Daphnia magna]|uniref:HEAT shock factor-binding protein 1 n=1 Tax=Daphnia magna TaxID=35525 RepID=A0A164FFE4_9CRUS|nr:HEAT shock factor-binding protein 1 [Daphnia magna]
MAENNKLSASSEYQSDVSTELNVSASLSNNESSGSNVRDSVTSITTANAQSSTPDLKNVQDLTRYVELLLQQMQERFQNISDQRGILQTW